MRAYHWLHLGVVSKMGGGSSSSRGVMKAFRVISSLQAQVAGEGHSMPEAWGQNMAAFSAISSCALGSSTSKADPAERLVLPHS